MNQEYKALFVKRNTHRKVAVLAKKAGLTIDQYINELFDILRKMKI